MGGAFPQIPGQKEVDRHAVSWSDGNRPSLHSITGVTPWRHAPSLHSVTRVTLFRGYHEPDT